MDPFRNRNICRRFLNGTCRFGPRCFYRHEWPSVSSPEICRYYQKGECWYGERCRYLHVAMPMVDRAGPGRRGSIPAFSPAGVSHPHPDRRRSEPALLRSNVPFRQECSGSESTLNASTPQINTGSNPRNEQSQAGTSSAAFQNAESAQASCVQVMEGSTESELQEGGAAAAAFSNKGEVETEAFLQSKNVVCGICLEKVYEKENKKEHVFGILPNCNHPFCLKCIKTWRKTQDMDSDVVRACPHCRVRSGFYVPNKYWVEGQAKESVIAAFKEKFGKKRCCFFDRYGYCPYKSECLHLHVGCSNRVAFSYRSDDEDDDSIDLLGLFLAMTLLVDEDSDDDDDIPFFLRI